MGFILGDYIGTTIRAPSPHSLPSTRESSVVQEQKLSKLNAARCLGTYSRTRRQN